MRGFSRLFPWLLLLCLLPLPSVGAQQPQALTVFVQQSRIDQTATLYFVNPASGLSTPVTIAGIPAETLAVDLFTVLPQGVLYRHPLDGRVMLVLPDGQSMPHPFIPQNREGLLAVDWVLSPDGGSIAWVEVLADGSGGGMSQLFVADSAGNTITPLPPPPPSSSFPEGRALPLALTNDRQRLFYDAAFPLQPRPITDYFASYRDLHVYLAAPQLHQQVPGEPACTSCGVAISGDGEAYLRLLPADTGIRGEWWRFGQEALGIPPALDASFAQAGDAFYDESSFTVYYSLAQHLTDSSQDAQFALAQVDLLSQRQTLLVGAGGQRLRVLAIQDGGQSLLLADVYNDQTYKLELASQTLSPVAGAIWLGQLNLIP